ncbi:MAG: PBP1A family penicillin-binding protein [Thermodesulfobacteriota bacterium]
MFPSGVKASGPAQVRPRPWRLGWRLNLLSFVFSMSLVPILILVVGYVYFSQELPSIEALTNYRPRTVSFALSDDGRVVGEFYHEHRLVVPLKQVPRHVVAAFLAAEDANFFNHPGLDVIGIVRAAITNYRVGRIVQGGSTITQQVTKSFLLTNEKTFDRKIREALLAFRIEKNLSKEQILELYLNQIYLGRGAYGVESAARIYFDKHAADLTAAEAALLAGLVKAPGRYSPFRTPELARSRQIYVINRMIEAGFLSWDEGRAAIEEKLVFSRRPNVNLELTPQFTEYVRRVVETLVGPESLYNDGLKIYTTVNIEAQQLAQKMIQQGVIELTKRQGYLGPRERLNEKQQAVFLAVQAKAEADDPILEGMETQAVVAKVVPGRNQLEVRFGSRQGRIEQKDLSWALRWRTIQQVFGPGDVVLVRAKTKEPETGIWKMTLEPDPDTEGALVCMKADTGEVKAAVGGRDFNLSQFNRAIQAHRQPGSSFKPFIYAAAMDSGFTQASIVYDEPVEYKDQSGTWSPKNYGRTHAGPMTLYDALVRSVNVVAVKLIEMVGPQKAVDYAHKMGIKSELAPYLSLALGASEVTLLEMVSAFSTFPNLGEHAEPMFIYRIEDRDGKTIMEFKPKRIPGLSPETSYIMLDMLRGVVLRGTGATVAALGRPAGGKTGTTNDQTDAWFVGFTPDYVTGVWVGRDQRKSLGMGEQGGRTAAPIFLAFMKEFMKDKPVLDFKVPPGVVRGTQAVNENGELGELLTGFVFKKGQVGRGRSEEPKTEEEEEKPKETLEDIQERMRRYLEKKKM